jgi:hypothetical protein
MGEERETSGELGLAWEERKEKMGLLSKATDGEASTA